MGCSSSSSAAPNPAQTGDDMDGDTAPNDSGSRPDATVNGDAGPTGGDDGSSPNDAGTTETGTASGVAAGEAGAAAFCSAVCAGLLACVPDGGPCNCTPGSAAIERADYVDNFTSCVRSAIVADCSDAGGVVEGCQVTAAAAINPTAAGAAFCKNLEFTHCANILPNCLTNAGIYGDTTIAAFSNCFSDLPDADVDGGCTSFGTCLGAAAQ
jgi:hypothetical protein